MKNTINNFTANLTKTILAAFAVLTIFSGAALADSVNLDMEGTTATIPKGNTVTRKIFGIQPGFDGSISLKLKWHAVNLIPNTFNPLKVVVKQGSNAASVNTTCYSFHSNKSPKCSFTIPVSKDKSGDWVMTITNNSNDEVIAFNLEKGSDINPLVPNFKSTFTPNCPNTVNLDMEGTTLTLGKGNTQERRIFGIGTPNGKVILKMKWHAVNLLPTFNSLKVEVINGNFSQTKTCYSLHSGKSPVCSFEFDSGSRPPSQWKLRVTNNSGFEVIGFNITKESSDLNPLVPSFKSTYKAYCN